MARENDFITNQLQKAKSFMEEMAEKFPADWVISDQAKKWILDLLETAYIYVPDDENDDEYQEHMVNMESMEDDDGT